MKTMILAAISALAFGTSTMAAAGAGQKAAKGDVMNLNQLDIRREGKNLLVDMILDAQNLRMKTNQEVVYTPMLVNGKDTLRMRPLSVAGRNRFYSHLRADDNKKDPTAYRAGEITSPISYSYSVPWSDWMGNATLAIEQRDCGCCGADKGKSVTPIAEVDLTPKVFDPAMLYITPEAEAVKMRSIAAKAYVDFPVNRIEIYPDYRKNPAELAKIIATIDSVRADENLTFTSIHIKGFASPEGSYANNTRLAKGRTQTLADYVRKLYKFDKDVITTSFEPEDWAGLEAYVKSDAAKRTLSNPSAVLALITDPAYKGRDDERDHALRAKFPADYAFLLAEVYPGLRHADYSVNCNVRTYSDPAEIIAMMKKAPQNLSLNELYVAAQSVEPGSDIFNEAFEIAAKMFPEDSVANLNAAAAAIQRNDLKGAAKYLGKAGDSEQAKYARAVYLGKSGDYAKAEEILSGLKQTEQVKEARRQLEKVAKSQGDNFIPLAKTIVKP